MGIGTDSTRLRSVTLLLPFLPFRHLSVLAGRAGRPGTSAVRPPTGETERGTTRWFEWGR